MRTLFIALILTIGSQSTSSGCCLFPWLPTYSAGYPGFGWGYPAAAPAYGYGYGYPSSNGCNSCSYAPMSYGGCSNCGVASYGGCSTCAGTGVITNYGTISNCAPGEIRNSPVIDDNVPGYEDDREFRSDPVEDRRDRDLRNDRVDDLDRPLRRDDNMRTDDFGGMGLDRNRGTGDTYRREDSTPADDDDEWLRRPMTDPAPEADQPPFESRQKPPITDPQGDASTSSDESEEAATPEDTEMLAPEKDTTQAFRVPLLAHDRQRSNIFEVSRLRRANEKPAVRFASRKKSSQVSDSQKRNQSVQWISAPMPVGRVRS